MGERTKVLSGEELHCYRGCIDREVPGRGGVKDYAPNGTWLQEKHLEKYYETYREVLSEERVQIQKSLLIGEWNSEEKHVELKKSVGNTAHAKGHSYDGKIVLHPEEALFLMDEGCMEVYYGGLPLSLQQAFALFLHGDITIDHYHVYAHLSRAGLGYIVRRHLTDSDITLYEKKIRLDQHIKKKSRRDPHESTLDSAHTDEQTKDMCTEGLYTPLPEQRAESMDSETLRSKRTCRDMSEETESLNQNKKIKCSDTVDCVTSQPVSVRETDIQLENSKSKQNQEEIVQVHLSTHERDPGVKTESGSDNYTNWNFSEVHFPDLGSANESYVLNPPLSRYLPGNVNISKDSLTLHEDVLLVNQSLKNMKAYRSFLEDEQLEFSFPDSVHDKVKSKARNWGEYKRELSCEQDKSEDLNLGPVGHLWSGDVKPLVKPQDAICTAAVLDKLKVIGNVAAAKPPETELDSKLRIMFDVYLPNKNFKKSSPGPPDHRIVVIRIEDPPPDLATINHFCTQCKDNVPLHWAVVDNGDVSFYSFDSVDLPTDISMG